MGWPSSNNGALEYLQEILFACKQEWWDHSIDKIIENDAKVLWGVQALQSLVELWKEKKLLIN